MVRFPGMVVAVGRGGFAKGFENGDPGRLMGANTPVPLGCVVKVPMRAVGIAGALSFPLSTTASDDGITPAVVVSRKG